MLTRVCGSGLACYVLLTCAHSVMAGIVVLGGGYGTEVRDGDGYAGTRIPWGSGNSSQASSDLPGLNASASFIILGNDSLITLNLNSTHSVSQTTQQDIRDWMSSRTVGGVWIETDRDLLVSTAGSMSYALGGVDAGAGMFLEIANQNQDVIHRSGADSAYLPLSGTIAFDDSIILDGGTQYFIDLGNEVGNFIHRFPDGPSTASSRMSLRIEVVPEPATVVLLLPALLLLRRPVRR